MPQQQIWLGPRAFISSVGATGPSAVGNEADIRKATAWVFPGGVTGTVNTNLLLPFDRVPGTPVEVFLLWSRPGTGTGTTVDFDCLWAQVVDGDQVDEPAGTPIAPANPPSVPAAEALKRTDMGDLVPDDDAPGRAIRLAVRRTAGGYTDAAWLLGVELRYTTA